MTTVLEVANRVLADYMPVFFIAFAVSFVATPLMRMLAVRHGIIDWPDMARKSHVMPVAYLGGLAVCLAFTSGVFLFYLFPGAQAFIAAPSNAKHIVSIAFGAICVTLVGFFDDVYGISPRVKIGGQFLAAGVLAMSSQSLGTLFVMKLFSSLGLTIDLKIAYVLGAALIGLFVLVGCNSMNLLDGLDGLAAGVTTIACIGFLVIAIFAAAERPTNIDPVRLVMCLALLGSLLGFLPYNFNPANIFLGDAGSLLLGYLCAALILLFADQASQGPSLGPRLVMAALVVFALPIADTALAIFRRKMRRQPIFCPDNQHMHHQLLRVLQNSGLSPGASVKLAVLAFYVVAALFGVLGGSLLYMRWRYAMAIFLPLFGFIVVSAYKLGQRQSLVAEAAALSHEAAGAEPPPATGQQVVPVAGNQAATVKGADPA